MIRRTPSSFMAQTFARYGIACGGSSWSRPWRGRKATRLPPTSPIVNGADGSAVRRLDLDLLDVLEERVEARAPEDADLSRRRPVSFAALA